MIMRFGCSIPSLVVLAVTLLATETFARADVVGDPPEPTLKRMIEAVKERRHDEFLSEADDKLRAALTKQQFDAVSNIYAPRMKTGYKTSYLGRLKQQGHVVFLWKLELADGKDDTLVKMAVKDAKVSGIWLQ